MKDSLLIRLHNKTVGMVVLALLLALGLTLTAAPVQALYDLTVCEGTDPFGEISDECRRVMEAFPAPSVLPIQHDGLTLDNYTFWKVNNTQPPVFNAPNGDVIRNMPPGFNFVRVMDTSVEGWVSTASGEWLRRDDVLFNQASYFKGVRILDGLENQFAWVLSTGAFFSAPYPGGSQDVDNGRLLRRYDLINIFAEVYDDDGWRWYMIGPNQWIEQRLVAKASRIERPEEVTGRWVAIDLYEQTVTLYEDDTPVFATLTSTGVPGWDTREGVFEIWARLDRDGMSGSTGAPTGWDLQSVPWVMYFDGSISLHGTYWHDFFGYRHSRGCVNLSISDAHYVYRWLNDTDQVDEDGNLLNFVYVHSSGEYRTSGAATK